VRDAGDDKKIFHVFDSNDGDGDLHLSITDCSTGWSLRPKTQQVRGAFTRSDRLGAARCRVKIRGNPVCVCNGCRAPLRHEARHENHCSTVASISCVVERSSKIVKLKKKLKTVI
jgi:hypothetical protein